MTAKAPLEARTYVGVRLPDGALAVNVTSAGSKPRPLRHVVYHSPTGLECGYGGSGPADLALSILVDALPRGSEGIAFELHQLFKQEVVARLPQAGFTLAGTRVAAWLDLHELQGEDLERAKRRQREVRRELQEARVRSADDGAVVVS